MFQQTSVLVSRISFVLIILSIVVPRQSTMTKVGGTGEAQDPNDEIKALAEQVKGHVESKLNRTFNKFEVVSYKTQLVNGVNYFIKVKVGDNEHLHVRAYKPFQGDVSLHSVQENKTHGDELEKSQKNNTKSVISPYL